MFVIARCRTALLIAAVVTLSEGSLMAQSLVIAAASDLQGGLPQVIADYKRQTGQAVRVTFGSSGNFFAQLSHGAPFDVFMSADIEYPRQLERAGLIEPGTLYAYGTGRLVLWTLKGSAAVLNQGIHGLTAPAVRRIAIANPAHAPYGRAAVAALRHAGIYERVQSKLVLGENISQAAQFVQSGNADVGLVAQSIALLPNLAGAGVTANVPPQSYPAIEQAAVIVKATTHSAAAHRFMAFLKTPAAVATLQRFGFEAPPQVPAR